MTKTKKKPYGYALASSIGGVLGYIYASLAYTSYVKSAGNLGVNAVLIVIACLLFAASLWLWTHPRSPGAALTLSASLCLGLLPMFHDVWKGGGVDPAFASIVILPLLVMVGITLTGAVIALRIFLGYKSTTTRTKGRTDG